MPNRLICCYKPKLAQTSLRWLRPSMDEIGQTVHNFDKYLTQVLLETEQTTACRFATICFEPLLGRGPSQLAPVLLEIAQTMSYLEKILLPASMLKTLHQLSCSSLLSIDLNLLDSSNKLDAMFANRLLQKSSFKPFFCIANFKTSISQTKHYQLVTWQSLTTHLNGASEYKYSPKL